MKVTVIVSMLLSFALSAILGPRVIPILRRVKAGQTEREDGPASHLNKTGTPTMGAFIFLIAYTVVSLFLVAKYPATIPVLILTLAFSLVGFCDDFIKVVLKRSEGLTPVQKAALQLVVSVIYCVWIHLSTGGFTMLVPFTNNMMVTLPAWLGYPVFVFIIVGTVNGSNFTDGVDGLETSVTAALCMFFLLVSFIKGEEGSIAPAAGIMFGALLGFLIYNLNKAKVFMGDTGSLALGGFVVACAFHYNLGLYLPLLALIYFVEVLSVIIQVGYFKLTHGKRIFRMAPIHHHFELGGWSETKVVGVFTIVTIMLGAFTLLFI
ncbi:MAG: phospho-N-acetylmuramoyl-pentapeptide-transferase [Lachnospiraceae bacterium]|nr:phospho-N-acetylmuramoyl-pentapeptide-transferase [Lachnospiraceae bacterium]